MDENAVRRFNGGTSINVTNTTEAGRLLAGLNVSFKDAFRGITYKAYATNWLDEDKFGSLGSWENWKYNPNVGVADYFNFFNASKLSATGRLIISGSASCLRYWGLMTGAYFAGIKSANWAINFMNGNRTMPYSVCDDP
jgi:hypothetical protein